MEKTNVIFVFVLLWVFLSLFFWSLAFKTEKVFFYNLGVSLPYFYSLKKHYRQNKQHFCIFLGVSIPFFIFWVNDVQSKKKMFLQSWCVLTLLLIFEETLSRTNVIFVFFLAWAYLPLVFWSMVFKAEKKCFSTILVCPYLTFDFWRNTIENTSAIFCDFLAWAYVTLKF